MKGHFFIIFGLRHLTVPTTSRIDLLTDILRIRLLLRLGEETNKKSPTFVSLDHEDGPTFPLRR
jgi:hypothetical protein